MPNSYYSPSGWPGTDSSGSSGAARAEMALIEAGFAKLPSLPGNGGLPVRVNSSATALEAVSIATMQAALSITGTFNAPSGTLMLFQQASAPTGWTKQTTHNDKALRVVSGTPGSGGATAFSSIFGSSLSTGAHSITQAELPNCSFTVNDPGHTHPTTFVTPGSSGISYNGNGSTTPLNPVESATTGITVDSGGSGTAHSHTLSLDLQYVDLIIASKD